MANPIILTRTGSNTYKNPGNGFWRIIKKRGIKNITIGKLDSVMPLTGIWTFSIGDKALDLDLASGERWIMIFSSSPYVDITITGSSNEDFDIIVN